MPQDKFIPKTDSRRLPGPEVLLLRRRRPVRVGPVKLLIRLRRLLLRGLRLLGLPLLGRPHRHRHVKPEEDQREPRRSS
jgi:predicted metalloprotease